MKNKVLSKKLLSSKIIYIYICVYIKKDGLISLRKQASSGHKYTQMKGI